MSPALPQIVTPALLTAIKKTPNLPSHTWYFVAVTALSILNRPDEVTKVYTNAIGHTLDRNQQERHGKFSHRQSHQHKEPILSAEEQLRISRRIREALIKSAAIAGLPRAINSLLALKAITPPHLIDEPMGYSPTSRPVDIYDVPSSQILHRGQVFFDKVYGKVSKRVMSQMDRSGTEDLGLTARLIYGYILSNTNVLSPAETSFVVISALIPQDVNPQLKGHLKGALNGGATIEEVKAVRDVVLQICKAAGMRKLGDGEIDGWGWRKEVANL